MSFAIKKIPERIPSENKRKDNTEQFQQRRGFFADSHTERKPSNTPQQPEGYAHPVGAKRATQQPRKPRELLQLPGWIQPQLHSVTDARIGVTKRSIVAPFHLFIGIAKMPRCCIRRWRWRRRRRRRWWRKWRRKWRRWKPKAESDGRGARRYSQYLSVTSAQP